MKKLFKFFLFFCAILLITLVFFIAWVDHEGEPMMIEQAKKILQSRFKVKIEFQNYKIFWFRRRIEFKNISFSLNDYKATIKTCLIQFDIPDFTSKQLSISKLILIEPHWIILKQNKRLKFFPDIFQKTGKTHKKHAWTIFIRKVILQNFTADFIDHDMNPSFYTQIHGERFIVFIDQKSETIHIKSYFHDSLKDQTEFFLKIDFPFINYHTNFSFIISGNNCDFALINRYQYNFSKLKIKKSSGSFYVNLSNHLGVLNGYAYLKLFNLKFEFFNKSIFKTVLGLSRKSFLHMLKNNDNEIVLDFFIYGTNGKPEMKPGNFSKGFFLKAPVSLAKDSFHLIESLFNTVLFGIPKKIIKAGKNIGKTEKVNT